MMFSFNLIIVHPFGGFIIMTNEVNAKGQQDKIF